MWIVAATIICFLFALKFEKYEGGADNYIHYRVSHYAFKYPSLFLDHWGKPFFTLISAPFAQFGIKGLLFFNVLCGVSACFFAHKIALKIGLTQSWAAFIIAISMPVYFVMMASAMTEVFFSFILILSIYLFLQEKYVHATILFSFLFLVRTEGYILYPVFIFALALKKQWKIIPFLATGFLLYSVIGLFYFGHFLWLINQNPYGDTSDMYGKGELLYFVKQYKNIFGRPTAILIFVGFVIVAFQSFLLLFKEKKIKYDFLLIEGIWILYFVAHSYVWWSGTGASAGLIRVMAGITPLAAITGGRTISWIAQRSNISSAYNSIVAGMFCLFLCTIPFKTNPIPYKYDERDKTIQASVEWMKNSEYADVKVYFYEPLIYFLLYRDPFDHSAIKELVDDREHPENSVKPGELVFYDMHFGPNEGRLPLEKLMDNPKFRLVNYFEPLTEIKVLGGYSYAVLVFERVELNQENNQILLQKFKSEKTKTELWKKIISTDKNITNEEFTPVLEIKADELPELNDAQILRAEMEYQTDTLNKSLVDQYLVVSIEKNGESLIYKAEPLEKMASGKSIRLFADAILSQKLTGDETIKIYIWNKSRHTGIIKKLDVYKVKKSY